MIQIIHFTLWKMLRAQPSAEWSSTVIQILRQHPWMHHVFRDNTFPFIIRSKCEICHRGRLEMLLSCSHRPGPRASTRRCVCTWDIVNCGAFRGSSWLKMVFRANVLLMFGLRWTTSGTHHMCCSSPDVWPGRSIRFHLVSSSPSSQPPAISKSQAFAEVGDYDKIYECAKGEV